MQPSAGSNFWRLWKPSLLLQKKENKKNKINKIKKINIETSYTIVQHTSPTNSSISNSIPSKYRKVMGHRVAQWVMKSYACWVIGFCILQATAAVLQKLCDSLPTWKAGTPITQFFSTRFFPQTKPNQGLFSTGSDYKQAELRLTKLLSFLVAFLGCPNTEVLRRAFVWPELLIRLKHISRFLLLQCSLL